MGLLNRESPYSLRAKGIPDWARVLLSLVLSLGVLSGCSKESGNGSVPAMTPPRWIDPGAYPPGYNYDIHPLIHEPGHTVDVILEGFNHEDKVYILSQFVGDAHPIDPVDFRLNVQLIPYTWNNKTIYAGNLKLGYYDYTGSCAATGNYCIANLETGFGSNGNQAHPYYGMPDFVFNQWFLWQGKQVFHAFFQDMVGAVVLVVDGGNDLGDGGGYTTVKGSIWFKNFQTTVAPERPEDKCWFHPLGPYTCQTFKNSQGLVVTTSRLEPSLNDGYRKLGTFSGLDKVKAFGH